MSFLKKGEVLKSNDLLDYIYFEKPANSGKGRNPEKAMLAACKIVTGVHKGEKVTIDTNGEKGIVKLASGEQLSDDNRFAKALIFYNRHKSKEPYKLLDQMYKILNKDKLQGACKKFDDFIEQTINFEHDENKKLNQKIKNKVNKIDFNVRLSAFIERKSKKYNGFAFLPGFNCSKHAKTISQKLSVCIINKKKEFLSELKNINDDASLEKFIGNFYDYIAYDIKGGLAWFQKNKEKPGRTFFKIKNDLVPKLENYIEKKLLIYLESPNSNEENTVCLQINNAINCYDKLVGKIDSIKEIFEQKFNEYVHLIKNPLKNYNEIIKNINIVIKYYKKHEIFNAESSIKAKPRI